MRLAGWQQLPRLLTRVNSKQQSSDCIAGMREETKREGKRLKENESQSEKKYEKERGAERRWKIKLPHCDSLLTLMAWKQVTCSYGVR